MQEAIAHHPDCWKNAHSALIPVRKTSPIGKDRPATVSALCKPSPPAERGADRHQGGRHTNTGMHMPLAEPSFCAWCMAPGASPHQIACDACRPQLEAAGLIEPSAMREHPPAKVQIGPTDI